MAKRDLPLAAADLLPHKGRMCCIDRLIALRDNGADAEVRLRPEHALVDGNGRLDPSGFIELAAQTAGAMFGAAAPGDAPDLAMLVSAQKVRVAGIASAGDTLIVTASILGEMAGMISLGFAVRTRDGARDDRILAEGRLTVFVPDASDAPLPFPLAGQSGPAGPFPPAAPGNGLPDRVAASALRAPACVEQGPDGHVMETGFVFRPDFPGFDGHFPGNPIVPGIVQIMAAAATAAPGKNARITGLKRCKFLRPVLPSEEIRARVTISESPEGFLCHAALHVGDEPCSEMQFTLGAISQ